MATNACPTRHAATGFFSACVALAHGLPWNLWLVNTDGTNAHELAGVESDDGSVAWSPDGSALFVYGGNGAFVVNAPRSLPAPQLSNRLRLDRVALRPGWQG